MVATLSKRIFELILNYLSQGGFSSELVPPSSINRDTFTRLNNEVSVEYTIPASLCQHDISGEMSYFPVSSILAVFDEISSHGLIVQDRSHRPGVSVTLSAEILKPCFAGERVRLVSKCDKIGRNMAFCSMELHSLSGGDPVLAARGKHMKFVQMGFVWNMLTSSLLFPLVLYVLEYWVNRKSNKSSGSTINNTTGRVNQELLVTPITIQALSSGTTGNSTGKLSSLGKKKAGEAATATATAIATAVEYGQQQQQRQQQAQIATRVSEEDDSCYEMRIRRPQDCNIFGKLHGGALGAAIEKACMLGAGAIDGGAPSNTVIGANGMSKNKQQQQQQGVFVVTSMEVTYISPIQGQIIIAESKCGNGTAGKTKSDNNTRKSAATSKTTSMATTTTTGRVLSRKTGDICAQYKCSWGNLMG